MSDEEFDALWTKFTSSLPVISSTEEITEEEWARISPMNEEEEVEQDEA